MAYSWESSILIGWSFMKSLQEKFVMSKKNKAKKRRESRRSTQGVTLDIVNDAKKLIEETKIKTEANRKKIPTGNSTGRTTNIPSDINLDLYFEVSLRYEKHPNLTLRENLKFTLKTFLI